MLFVTTAFLRSKNIVKYCNSYSWADCHPLCVCTILGGGLISTAVGWLERAKNRERRITEEKKGDNTERSEKNGARGYFEQRFQQIK